jgi:hypothetical protein
VEFVNGRRRDDGHYLTDIIVASAQTPLTKGSRPGMPIPVTPAFARLSAGIMVLSRMQMSSMVEGGRATINGGRIVVDEPADGGEVQVRPSGEMLAVSMLTLDTRNIGVCLKPSMEHSPRRIGSAQRSAHQCLV